MKPNTAQKKAAWVAIAVACVACFEGLRQTSYLDPISIPTICYGETKGVKLGQYATLEQCNGLLAESLQIANKAVDSCVKAPLPDYRRAALVSFTYNVGGGALCRSTLVRKLNAGDTIGACNELTRWDMAGGRKLPGLTKRRAAEREMCLKGAV